MGFSLSGSTITQSGTDTSLSGLSGIAGVTTRIEGIAGISARTTYILASTLRLVVSGTLSFNPALECLEIYRNTDPILISGSLTVGTETARANGIVQRSYHEAIRCYGRSADPWTVNNGFHVTGNLILYGCIVITAAAVSVTAGNLTLRDVKIYRLASLRSGFAAMGVQITISGSASVDIVDLEDWVPSGFNINACVSIGQSTVNVINLKGIRSIGPVAFDQLVAGIPRPYPGGVIEDYIPLTTTSYAIYPFSTPVRLLNAQAFNAITARVANRPAFNSNPEYTAFVEAVRQLNLTVLDSSGSAIQNALLYYRDVNNGNRALSVNNRNYVPDFVYSANSDTSGLASVTVIEMAWYLTTYPGPDVQVEIPPSNADLRISSDLTIRPFWASYLHNIQGFSVQSGGLGSINQSFRLAVDLSIVQTNPTTVAAYTGYSINTSTNTVTLADPGLMGARAYDWFKLWKLNNFALEYPTVSSLVCVKDGTTLNFGDLDVVVDGVTFGSHATVNKIKANTVTFINGADYEVIVEDSTGIRYPALTFTGFPSSNNANGIAPAPKVGLVNLRTNDSETYMVSGSSIAIKLSDVNALPDDDVRATFDAIGYIRPLDQTIKGNRTEPISVVFEEWTDSEGTPIVGLAAAADIDFNLINERLLLPNTTSFYGALMRWENVTAGPDFLLFPTDAVRRFQFVKDRLGQYIVIDPSWTIAAKEAATQSPIILDFVVQKYDVSGDPVDPFEHGLASTASGLTDRPEVVIAFQSAATSVRVDSFANNSITADALADSAIDKIKEGSKTPSIR